MAKLSKQALMMAQKFGLDPAQIKAKLEADANRSREIVEDEVNRVIKGDLGEFGGYAGSLKSYKPVSKKRLTALLSVGVTYFTHEITVESDDHKGITGKAGTPLNVFELIDTGRKKLKKLRGKKRYLLWSWAGKDQPLSIPVKNKGRGIRNAATGKFGFTTAAVNRPTQTPIRAEPRQKVNPYQPSDNVRGSRFFARGPLKAVPGRDLYKRIYNNALKKIKREKLLFDLILIGKKK